MNITDLIEQQSADFEREMAKVIKRLERNIDDIIMSLRMRDGQMIVSAENITKAMSLSKQLEVALKDSGYYELAERSLKANNKIMSVQHEGLKELLGRERLGKIDTTTLQALQSMKFTGMTDLADSEAIIGIREAIFNSVNLGLPASELRNMVVKKLDSLERYANTYIRTAKREFSQQVENNAADKIGFGEDKDDIWEYVPNILQTNSHKECIWAVGKQYFTNEEKIAFESGGLYSHSEPRWNCVHRFAITNVTYEEAFGGDVEELKDNTIPKNELLDAYKYGEKTGNEKLIFMQNGEVISSVTGGSETVALPSSIKNMIKSGEEITTIHNHPVPGAPSPRDIGLFAGTGGNQYIIDKNYIYQININRMSETKAMELFKDYNMKMVRANGLLQKMEYQISRGDLPKTLKSRYELFSEIVHDILVEFAKENKFDYLRINR